MHGRYEAVPMQCMACAATAAESREASESRDDWGKSAFDGVYIAVREIDGR